MGQATQAYRFWSLPQQPEAAEQVQMLEVRVSLVQVLESLRVLGQ